MSGSESGVERASSAGFSFLKSEGGVGGFSLRKEGLLRAQLDDSASHPGIRWEGLCIECGLRKFKHLNFPPNKILPPAKAKHTIVSVRVVNGIAATRTGSSAVIKALLSRAQLLNGTSKRAAGHTCSGNYFRLAYTSTESSSILLTCWIYFQNHI